MSLRQAKKKALAEFCMATTKARREHVQKRGKAGNLVKKALQRGDIVRGCCAVCGSASVEAHHEDYDFPLQIVWLCKKHHTARHVELNRERGNWISRYKQEYEKMKQTEEAGRHSGPLCG